MKDNAGKPKTFDEFYQMVEAVLKTFGDRQKCLFIYLAIMQAVTTGIALAAILR